MANDLNERKLSEEEVKEVQGGVYLVDGSRNEGIVSTRCLHHQCGWSFIGSKAKAAAAQQKHTQETGHTQFG